MAKLTLSSIPSGYATTAAHNTDNTAIEAAIENTLSRDGTSPNQMNANLDMNGYAILNQRATSGNENFLWMGTWTTGTVYAVNNLVYAPEGSNLGNTLICVTANTAGATLDGDATNWAVFAQRGASGAGAGDVVGPASSTADSLARYNGTTGKLLKDGAVIGTDVQAYHANLTALTAFTIDKDVTLAANSDVKLATQKATKTYTDTKVSSVTGTAPVVSSGGKTPAISMPAATASVNGYMSSTYAAKLDGIAAGATVGVATDAGVFGVGSFALMGFTTTTSLASGATAAGSTMNSYLITDASVGIAVSGTTPSGTWRNVSGHSIGYVSGTNYYGICQRIA